MARTLAFIVAAICLSAVSGRVTREVAPQQFDLNEFARKSVEQMSDAFAHFTDMIKGVKGQDVVDIMKSQMADVTAKANATLKQLDAEMEKLGSNSVIQQLKEEILKVTTKIQKDVEAAQPEVASSVAKTNEELQKGLNDIVARAKEAGEKLAPQLEKTNKGFEDFVKKIIDDAVKAAGELDSEIKKATKTG